MMQDHAKDLGMSRADALATEWAVAAAVGCQAALVVSATLFAALLAILAFGLFGPQLVRGAAAAEKPLAGLFFKSGEEGKVYEAPLLQSDVAIEVSGPIARSRVRQYFRNASPVWMEGIYVFPLPDDSAVDRLLMKIGDREIEGRILEREEARQVYEEAAEAGQHASLLSSERPNVFTTSVANIAPGETVVIEIEYQETLDYRDGLYSLRFPMVVAPRYTPGELALVRAPFDQQAPQREGPQPIAAPGPAPAGPETGARDGDLFGPFRGPEEGLGNPISLVVELDAGVALAEIASPSHEVEILSDGPGKRRITLSEGSVPADRNFRLEWRPEVKEAPEAALFGEELGGESFLYLSLLPPVKPSGGGERTPRDLIFVVDTSGSMYGPSMEQAKEALSQAIDRLQPGDRFNLIQFNSETSRLYEGLRPVSADTVRNAQAYIAALEADGGTEMRPALIAALMDPPDPSRLRQIVFLTDGAVGNERELFEVITNLLGESRLFTVGIGSAPNGYFMTKAAELGRGTYSFIGDVNEVTERMSALFRKLENPALTDIEVEVEGPFADRVRMVPALVPDLYIGDPVQVLARVSQSELSELRGSITLSGLLAGEPWSRRLDLEDLEPAQGIAPLWGRARLSEIESGLYRGGDYEMTRREAVATALHFGLVSSYTSLVAVDEEVVRPAGEDLRSGDVPRNLPDGMDYTKVFGAPGAAPQDAEAEPLFRLREAALSEELRQIVGLTPVVLPQGATPAELKAILGSLALLLAGLLLLIGWRREAAA